MYNKPLLQKSETEVFKQKKNRKKLVQSQQAKKLGRFEIKLDNVWIANNKQKLLKAVNVLYVHVQFKRTCDGNSK